MPLIIILRPPPSAPPTVRAIITISVAPATEMTLAEDDGADITVSAEQATNITVSEA